MDRLTKKDWQAIEDALLACLAGDWDDGDGSIEGSASSDDLSDALTKVTQRTRRKGTP